MTRDEFHARLRLQQRVIRRGLLLSMGLMVCAVIVAIAIAPPRRSGNREPLRGSPVHVLLVGVFTATIGIGATAFVVDKRHSLRCPQCETSLQMMRASLAIATNRCPKCGTALFNESGTTRARRPLQRLLVDSTMERSSSDLENKLRRLFTAVVVTMIAYLLAAGTLALAATIDVFTNLSRLMNTVHWFVMALFGLLSIALIWIRRTHQLRCPACNVTLDPVLRAIAIATATCGCCGERVLENSESRRAPANASTTPGAQLLPSMSELQDRCRRAGRRAWIILFPTIAPFVLIPTASCVFRPLVDWSDPESIQQFILNTLLSTAVVLPIVLSGLRWALRHDAAPVCPVCGAKLNSILKDVALATGRCGRCGGRVLRDESARPNPFATHTRIRGP